MCGVKLNTQKKRWLDDLSSKQHKGHLVGPIISLLIKFLLVHQKKKSNFEIELVKQFFFSKDAWIGRSRTSI
jgi:hypothetical protein